MGLQVLRGWRRLERARVAACRETRFGPRAPRRADDRRARRNYAEGQREQNGYRGLHRRAVPTLTQGYEIVPPKLVRLGLQSAASAPSGRAGVITRRRFLQVA